MVVDRVCPLVSSQQDDCFRTRRCRTAAFVRICNASGVVTAIDIAALRWLMFATFNSNKYDEDGE